MAAANFTRIIEQVLQIEGGVSDRPADQDPGKLTNRGVTQAVYDQWRGLKNLPPKSVREITTQEAVAIYKANYWRPIQGDKLPAGIDYAVLDYAVNSGPAQAVKDLQRVLGCAADGIVGLATLEALAVAELPDVINAYCDRRLAFMKKLKNWKHNQNGWTKRVAHVRAQSLAMVEGERIEEPNEELAVMSLAKAPPPKPTPGKKTATFWASITGGLALAWTTFENVIKSIPDLARNVLPQVTQFADKSPVAAFIVNLLAGASAAALFYVGIRALKKKEE
jgi:lysozyme family protein